MSNSVWKGIGVVIVFFLIVLFTLDFQLNHIRKMAIADCEKKGGHVVERADKIMTCDHSVLTVPGTLAAPDAPKPDPAQPAAAAPAPAAAAPAKSAAESSPAQPPAGK
jgi:hypothetical protein